MLRYVTLTQCAIGACVCKWNMSHSASVNRSDSPVPLLYTACYVTRDAPFFIRTLNIFFLGFLTFSWISWWLIQRWRRGRWSTNMQPFSRGWVPIFVFSDWPNKTVWFYGTKCLNNGCRKLSEKVSKKFILLASQDHFQLLLLRSFFYVSVSVQTVFSCLPSHTHTWHYPESESPFMPVCHWYISVIEKASDRLDGLKLYTG